MSGGEFAVLIAAFLCVYAFGWIDGRRVGIAAGEFRAARRQREAVEAKMDASAAILRELWEGTPDTPQRVATIRRADEVYRRMADLRAKGIRPGSGGRVVLPIPAKQRNPLHAFVLRVWDVIRGGGSREDGA